MHYKVICRKSNGLFRSINNREEIQIIYKVGEWQNELRTKKGNPMPLMVTNSREAALSNALYPAHQVYTCDVDGLYEGIDIMLDTYRGYIEYNPLEKFWDCIFEHVNNNSQITKDGVNNELRGNGLCPDIIVTRVPYDSLYVKSVKLIERVD